MKNNLNDFEKHILSEGIDLIHTKMFDEIIAAEAAGKQSIMTVGFVNMIISELKGKLSIDNSKVENVVNKF